MPVLAYIEVMALHPMAEHLGTHTERDLFGKLPRDLCSHIVRSAHNGRLSNCARAVTLSLWDYHIFLHLLLYVIGALLAHHI
ncbi:MAG: hypothetical protein V7724_10335 [Sediminicola sp.]